MRPVPFQRTRPKGVLPTPDEPIIIAYWGGSMGPLVFVAPGIGHHDADAGCSADVLDSSVQAGLGMSAIALARVT
jgi:hypothetical protein